MARTDLPQDPPSTRLLGAEPTRPDAYGRPDTLGKPERQSRRDRRPVRSRRSARAGRSTWTVVGAALAVLGLLGAVGSLSRLATGSVSLSQPGAGSAAVPTAVTPAPAATTVVVPGVTPTSGAVPRSREVTANGVTAGGYATPRVVRPSTATTLVAKAVSGTARTVTVRLRVVDPAGRQVLTRSWTGQALTASAPRLLKVVWTTPAATARYRAQVTVLTGTGTVLVDNPAAFTVTARPAGATATGTTTTTPTTTATPSGTTTPTPTTTGTTTPSTGRFGTLPPGSTLPSGAQCATAVRSVPTPKEIKGVNATANATQGSTPAGATGYQARVDGRFTGTTEQVLRWAACKWGVDEDVVKAQAAIESWWRMDTQGDLGSDPTRCAPGHGIGVDGKPGQCPESWGLLQIRYPYNQAAFPDAIRSSAFNADWAYASFRSCYEGQMTWLNTVERVGTYQAGDLWGCVGVWFSGRWHTAAAEGYITRVKGYLADRIWTTPNFAQP